MDTSNTTPRRVLTWLEQDAYNRWILLGPPTKAWTKRWTHKRERREARALIAEQLTCSDTECAPNGRTAV
jgi:hypothetical protein